jgi:hypothetical protein
MVGRWISHSAVLAQGVVLSALGGILHRPTSVAWMMMIMAVERLVRAMSKFHTSLALASMVSKMTKSGKLNVSNDAASHEVNGFFVGLWRSCGENDGLRNPP